MPGKYRCYSAKFKLQVIAAAEESNNSRAASQFGVAESNVRGWRKNKAALLKMPSYKCANRGKPCKWPHLEERVSEWVTSHRNDGCIISRPAIRIFALKEAKKLGISQFVASPVGAPDLWRGMTSSLGEGRK